MFVFNFLNTQAQKPFVKLEENFSYRLIDTLGNPITLNYEKIEEIGDLFFASNNDSVFVLNKNFDIIFRGEYDFIADIGNKKNQYIIGKNSKYGVVDDKNKIIIPFIYDYIINKGNCYLVEKDNLFGILNLKGKVLIPIIYNEIVFDEFNKKLPIFVQQGKEYKLINTKNQTIVADFPYYHCSISQDFIIASNDFQKYYLLDAKLNVVLGPLKYIYYYGRSSFDFIVGKNNNEYIILDSKTFKTKGTYNYIPVHLFKTDVNLIPVEKNGKWGFIDNKGNLIIEPQYEAADEFTEGLAPVIKNGKWGFINSKNEVVIPFQFVGSVTPFENGVAKYFKDPESKARYYWCKVGLINKSGKIIAEPIYKEIGFIAGNKAIIVEDSEMFLFDFVTKQKIMQIGQYNESPSVVFKVD